MLWSEHLVLTSAGLALVLCFAQLFVSAVTRRGDKSVDFWASTPNVGVPNSNILPWSRAAIRAITGSSRTALEGYKRFSKDNTLFALPSTGTGAIVVLPPSQLNLLNRSEAELRAFDPQIENIQPRYTIGDPGLYENILHFEVVRQHMIKDVGVFAASSAEELNIAFRHIWGESSRDWTEIAAFDTCARIISQVSNRAFVGLPLCRNEVLLEQTRLYANAVYVGSAMITALPRPVRPLFGHLMAIPAKRYLAQCKRILVPFVEERLKLWDQGRATEQPNDAVQWMIEKCAKGTPAEMHPARITQRLLILNLVSIYTTAYAFANCVIDLYGSAQLDETLEGLRAELGNVVRKHGSIVTKAAIDELYRLDSTIRESMRISAFGIVTLQRIVGETGLALDLGHGTRDEYVCIPAGVRVGIPSQAIHHDPEYHENPTQFDAFRFSRPFESPDGQESRVQNQQMSVDVDRSFLTYGFGKHACPGRWFASQLMKQSLAYMIYYYDVELIGKSPEKKAVLNMILPPTEARIRIRRRRIDGDITGNL